MCAIIRAFDVFILTCILKSAAKRIYFFKKYLNKERKIF